MTVMAAIVKTDRVHVLADAANVCMENGELMGVAKHILPLGRLNAVFVARGPGCAPEGMVGMICAEWDHDSFDGFLADLPEMMEFYREHEDDDFPADLLFAGFSEKRRRPVAVGWHSQKEPQNGMKPGELYVVESGVISFGLPGLPAAEEFEPAKHAIPAFEQARREKLNLWYGMGGQVSMGYRIGVGISHAEVTESGVKSAWLKHWPDRIGKRIDPFKTVQAAMAF